MQADRRLLRIALILSLTCLTSPALLRAQQPFGSEIRINQATAGVQWLPDVATAADGRFAVAWVQPGNPPGQSASFVTVRLFDAAGRPRSNDIRVARVAAQGSGRPAIAMASDGRFVVVWGGGAEDPHAVFGRRFAANGSALGERFRLSRPTAPAQFEADVAMAVDGSFIAVWDQDDGGTSEGVRTTDVFFRRFGADGQPLGPEALAIGGFEEQSHARVATANGRFVVVCQSFNNGDGAFFGILARLFTSAGAPLGDQFLVNFDPNEVNQVEPAVAMASSGRFAITWTDFASDSGRERNVGPDDIRGVMVRFYHADGSTLRPGVPANLFLAGQQESTAVSALPNDGFVVLWMSGGAQDGDATGIVSRVYGPTGGPRSGEVPINNRRVGAQSYPSVAVAPNGKGVAAWTGPDAGQTGILARLLRSPF
jgi:hypothetical protein